MLNLLGSFPLFMKKIYFLLIFMLGSVFSFSQKIENVHVEQQGKQVVINYDITGAQAEQTFEVSLLYSQNGYDWKQATKGLTGDIGTIAHTVMKNTITWDALQDVNKLVGTGFMFKVKVNVNSRNINISSFKDSRDNKIYKTVKIGNQTWMAENLNYKTSSGSWCYNDFSSNCQTYGRLYNWETAKTVCPDGWHLASDDEWTELIDFLGGPRIAGGKMKQNGTTFWKTPNKGEKNGSGFLALPGGDRDYNGKFGNMGYHASFWSSTEDYSIGAWLRLLYYDDTNVLRYSYNLDFGYSVRCVKDK
jgi:uncharacterized protein (TIGR02145 family)